jgi:hypothetical protein
MPLAHTEGPGHQERLERVAGMAEVTALAAPPSLRPLYQFSAGQARAHLQVIARFGRFPHRNPILGRASTPEETGAKAVVPGLFGEQGGWLSASGRKFRPITLLVGTGSIDAVTSIPFSR